MKSQLCLITLILILNTLFSISTYSQQWGLYTFYSTKDGTTAKLVDTSGTLYKTWTFNSAAKYSAYLIPGDTVVRTTSYTVSGSPGNGGVSGKIQKVTWDGTVVWEMTYSSTTTQMHHDICPMPNGNVLFISYDVKTAAQATQAGSSTSAIFYSEKIMEVRPTGVGTISSNWGYTVVWEWKLWDHLCQNYNNTKDNYVSSIVLNPQLLNINYTGTGTLPDRFHMNGLDYNPDLNQIVFSMHFMNSAFVIDHSTTTAEAAGHTGGNSGKGGDFLYRWGNPATYGASGTTMFSTIHDAHWVPADNPLYPNYLAGYNNQGGTGGKTAITIWNPPYNGYNYDITPGQAYGPSNYAYQYTTTFTATNEGNSQQLANGNMMVNNFMGNAYEVSPTGAILQTITNSKSTHAYRYSKCYVRGPVVTASASPATICSGEQVTLYSSANSVTETNPTYTYAWSSGETTQNPLVNPTTNATFTVTVTNTTLGCSSSASVSVSVLSLPPVPTISQNAGTLNASLASGYQWYENGNLIQGATSQNYIPVESGSYQVEGFDANGCSTFSNGFTYEATQTPIINFNASDITVFPNPSSGIVTVCGADEWIGMAEISIYDVLGNKLFYGKGIKYIDISMLENGIYFLTLTLDGKTLSRKIDLIK